MATVEFDHVTKKYDDKTLALSELNMSIDEGEFIVLVGPSGCGKSTALRMLAGLETATQGEIRIDGNIVNQQSPQQRNIAMVFQNYALYPHMSVMENLAFPLKMLRMPKISITNKIQEIADILHLTDVLDRKPKQLSGGQRQRVAMGRALVRDPSVFLLDEPLSNLDANLRTRIRTEILKIQKRINKTTLYVTHDQVEAMTLGDRVAVIKDGKLQQFSTPEHLYKHPDNVFVAEFIGSPGMNILPASIQSKNKNAWHIVTENQQFDIDVPLRQVSMQNIEKTVSIGIRPESFQLNNIENGIAIKVVIDAVEYLGSDSLIYFKLTDNTQHDKKLVAKITDQLPASAGTVIELYVDPESLHLFDNNGTSIKEKT